jgi:hypothetical protein
MFVMVFPKASSPKVAFIEFIASTKWLNAANVMSYG